MIRAKVKLSTVAHRGYATFFWLIHAESNELGTVAKQMLTEVVDRGRKLYSVNGSSLACYPSLPLCPSHVQPTQPFFQFSLRRMHKFSYNTTAQK